MPATGGRSGVPCPTLGANIRDVFAVRVDGSVILYRMTAYSGILYLNGRQYPNHRQYTECLRTRIECLLMNVILLNDGRHVELRLLKHRLRWLHGKPWIPHAVHSLNRWLGLLRC